MEIREANDDDWAAIWPIFREVVRARETYAFDPELSSDAARAVWMERPPGRTAVALFDGRVVGSAKMGPNRQGPGAHVGTASLMVSAQARGCGVGRALAHDVVETNEAAVALWQDLGFEIVGTVPEAFAHPRNGLVGLHVMWLAL